MNQFEDKIIKKSIMTDNELYLCFSNSYSGYRKEQLKPLLEKYHFFEDIKSHGGHFDKLKSYFHRMSISDD